MRTTHLRQPALLATVLLACIGFIGIIPAFAAPVGTAFTYQGQLFAGDTAVTDTCDFTFDLYDAATAGSALGSVSATGVPVTDGYFAVELDFGTNVFAGDARYLAITVQCTADSVATPLLGRVELSAVPYALYALEAATAADGWGLSGNAGTTAGTSFVGTTDDQPLELHVNGSRVLRLEQGTTTLSTIPITGTNIIGGIADNRVTSGVVGATIAGGGLIISGQPDFPNSVTDVGGTIGGGAGNQAGNGAGTTEDAQFATVGGGGNNTASGSAATVGGGQLNEASDFVATVGGGLRNEASDFVATVGGGSQNTASASRATVGGGFQNIASGEGATVPGGRDNVAAGNFSFAAGGQAVVDAAHDGTFLWSDNNGNFTSAAANEFAARATGGVRFVVGANSCTLNASTGSWSCTSSRAAKTDVAAVDTQAVLAQVVQLPISTWRFRGADGDVRHMGPFAQDFFAAFGLGAGDTTISTIDLDGVALAAIQGLHSLIQEQQQTIATLQQQNADLEAENAALEQRLTDLEARLTALEGE